jgi:hypothetical protein
MLNKHIIRFRISEKKFLESRNSVNKIIKAIRIRITEICEHSNVFELGEVEVDESCFEAKRVCSLLGRGELEVRLWCLDA